MMVKRIGNPARCGRPPPKENMTQRRIDTAKQMFLSGARNINRVSLEVGYNSNGYFSKSFKKIAGVSPSDFIAGLNPPSC